MVNLTLFIEYDGSQRILKPSKTYSLGSGGDCNIVVDSPHVAPRHLIFFFQQDSGLWFLQDLSEGMGKTFVNNQLVTEYPISGNTRVSLNNAIFLQLTPEKTVDVPSVTANYSTSVPPSPNLTTSSYKTPVATSSPNRVGRTIPHQIYEYEPPHSLRLLSWKDFVEEQVKESQSAFTRICDRFFLVTGFRKTPWLRNFGGYTLQGGNSLNAFEGFIIPNFFESHEEVVIKIEEEINKLKTYKNTDCFLARLTDVHIVDSCTQSFFGVEFFPIRRGDHNQADYRKFCVISHNRVRTYLLVENFGTDLFVSWITRFESIPSCVFPGIWLIISIIQTLVFFFTQQFLLAFIFLSLWPIYYVWTPFVMARLQILPKAANARFIIAVSFTTFFFIMIPFGITSIFRYLSY